MTILFIANTESNLKLVRESFSRGQISIYMQSFGTLNGFHQLLDKHDAVVFDFSSDSEFDLPIIQEIIGELTLLNKPSFALFRKNDHEFRNRLVKSGLNDYLTIPFDKEDIRIRLKNLLNLFQIKKENLISSHFHEYDSKAVKKIDNIVALLKNPKSDLKVSRVIKQSLLALHDVYNFKSLLYFEMVNDDEIKLKESVPPYPSTEEIIIPISNLPIVKEVLNSGKFIYREIRSSQEDNFTFIKSFLNVDFKAIGVYPVKSQSKTKHFLVLLDDQASFSDNADLHFLEAIVDIIELTYNFLTEQSQRRKETYPNLLSPESSKFLDLVINQLNFGIMVVDNQLQIKYINKSAANLLRIDVKSSQNNKLDKIIGKSNTRKILENRRKTEGTYERPEIEVAAANGEKILIGFTTTEFKTEDLENESFILSLKDITYSKELQEEMSRMDRLASLGVMASGIAHEIRNPLAGIKAIAQTFEEELSESDPKNEYVRRIIKQVNRLDDMLKTLFSYAKPQKPNRQFYHIEEILQEVLSLLKQKLYKHNIKLSQSYASNLPALYIDNGQIQQVLFNLILNSLEAIDKDGEINISIEPVSADPEKFSRKPFHKKITENPYIQINITDSGCGIPQENMQQIFNPFFTTKNFGTGLGLSIVYQIVQENNGLIYFESEEDKGTACYLFLPTFQQDNPEIKGSKS